MGIKLLFKNIYIYPQKLMQNLLKKNKYVYF